ncbi:unnamed protein product, partial [Colletotrichum noveboracense]
MSLDLGYIVSAKRTFKAVIHTIFQIIYFFLIKVKSYIYIFCSMLTNIFLKIIYAYLCIFKLALGCVQQHNRYNRLKYKLRKGGETNSRPITLDKTKTYKAAILAKLLCIISSNKGKDVFSSRNITWPLKLYLAITN